MIGRIVVEISHAHKNVWSTFIIAGINIYDIIFRHEI